MREFEMQTMAMAMAWCHSVEEEEEVVGVVVVVSDDRRPW